MLDAEVECDMATTVTSNLTCLLHLCPRQVLLVYSLLERQEYFQTQLVI